MMQITARGADLAYGQRAHHTAEGAAARSRCCGTRSRCAWMSPPQLSDVSRIAQEGSTCCGECCVSMTRRLIYPKPGGQHTMPRHLGVPGRRCEP
jgi:hypothetical protein